MFPQIPVHRHSRLPGIVDPRGRGARYNNMIGALYVLDTFTAANGTLLTAHTPDRTLNGNSWVNTGGNNFQIQSNLAKGNSASNNVDVIDTGVANVVITATYKYTTGDGNFGFDFRWQNSTNYWLVYCSGGSTWNVHKALSAVSVGTYALSNGVTYALKLIANGNFIGIYVNGTLVASTFDSTYNTQTKHGLYCENIGAGFGNFEVSGIVPGA